LRWIDEALRPLKGLPAKQRKRLRAVLALGIGIESIVVMEDACQLVMVCDLSLNKNLEE
jgi:hypothetical protein